MDSAQHRAFHAAEAAERAGRLREAIAGFLSLSRGEIAGEIPATRFLRPLAQALASAGLIDQAIDAIEQYLIQHPDDADGYSTLLLLSQYIDQRADVDRERHQRFDSLFASRVTPLPPITPPPLDGRRLRVGFVSADFRDHSVGQFVAPLFDALDRSRIEVHAFSNSTHPADDYTRRMREAVDGWHHIAPLDDDAAASLIRAQQIDVLIDCSGHTGGNRLLVFARRPAPVQLTWLGYPNRLELACIDGRITDVVADPDDDAGLLRLPDVFTVVEPIAGAPVVSPPPCLANGFITFGCTASLLKISDDTLATWSTALRATPDSRLLLIGRGYEDAIVRTRIAAALDKHGIATNRLNFIGRLPFDAYLNAHERIDLMLDTFPFNAHTTTVQNLWMGVPVITRAGDTHRSRIGASVLSAIGAHEWIAPSVDAFASIAPRLADDREQLAEIRFALRQQMLGSPLMNAARFARAFERLLLGAAHRIGRVVG